MPTSSSSRDHAALLALKAMDTDLFRALCDPSRIAVLSVLIRLGRSDIAAVAAELPQDRSVISRHLQLLADVGVVVAHREGRHVFYEVDGPGTLAKFEAILAELRRLAPLCCPTPR